MSVIIGPLNHSFCGIIGQWNVVNKSFEHEEGRNLRNSVPTPKLCKRVCQFVGWTVGRLVGWSVGRLVGWPVGRSIDHI